MKRKYLFGMKKGDYIRVTRSGLCEVDLPLEGFGIKASCVNHLSTCMFKKLVAIFATNRRFQCAMDAGLGSPQDRLHDLEGHLLLPLSELCVDATVHQG